MYALVVLSVSKSWFMGFMAGDGHVQRDGAWGAGYNTDPVLVAELKRVLLKEWGCDPYVRHKDRLRRKRIWTVRFPRFVAQDLLRYAPSWSTLGWHVPERVVCSKSSAVQAAFVRGFFDAEGSAYGKPKWSVTASSANREGLSGVLWLLESLGIEGKSYTYPREGELDAHVISVHKRSESIKFSKLVGFCALVKQKRLHGIEEASYGRESKWLKILPSIHAMRSEGMRHYEIESALDLYDRESIAAVAWERRLAGIKTRRDSMGPLSDKVVPLVDLGLSHRGIASDLGVSIGAVRRCVQWDKRQRGILPMEKGHRYTSRVDEICKAGLANEDAPVVARALGMTVKQVWDARKWVSQKSGIYKARVRLKDHSEEITRRRILGHSQADIARDIGCGQSAISQFCKRQGIS